MTSNPVPECLLGAYCSALALRFPILRQQILLRVQASEQRVVRAMHVQIRCSAPQSKTPRNQIQEKAFLVQTGLRLCFLVFDFASCKQSTSRSGARVQCAAIEYTVQNQTQESTNAVQSVPRMRCLVFDFGVY
eukprot:3907912-Rhodomonas_salina.2